MLRLKGCDATVCDSPTGSQRYLFASTSYNALPVTPKADPATSDTAQLKNSADSQARPGKPLMPQLQFKEQQLSITMCICGRCRLKCKGKPRERQRHNKANACSGVPLPESVHVTLPSCQHSLPDKQLLRIRCYSANE